MSDLLVKRDDLRVTRIAESEAPAPEDGQALLRVDAFGLTANNITYAVFGEAMNYWDFFPAPDGWGRVPMWGFAEVAESAADGLGPGQRVFGYLPPSTHLVVVPKHADRNGFVDGSPHRAHLPSAYHRYLFTDTDPFYDSRFEEQDMLLRPLFFTSFLLDDELGDGALAGASTVVLSSASAKTTIGTAFLLAQREGMEVIGLTSPGNVDFVEGLGIYERVVPYDDLDSLERTPTAFVDVAGDVELRGRIHRHLGDELTASIAVGATHWEEFRAGGGAGGLTGGADLPGPAPRMFFAPDRVTKRSQDWGRDGLAQRAAEAAKPFVEWVAGWLEVIPGQGLEGAERAYLEVIDGDVPPAKAHVIRL
jgi:hypothetical protein